MPIRCSSNRGRRGDLDATRLLSCERNVDHGGDLLASAPFEGCRTVEAWHPRQEATGAHLRTVRLPCQEGALATFRRFPRDSDPRIGMKLRLLRTRAYPWPGTGPVCRPSWAPPPAAGAPASSTTPALPTPASSTVRSIP